MSVAVAMKVQSKMARFSLTRRLANLQKEQINLNKIIYAAEKAYQNSGSVFCQLTKNNINAIYSGKYEKIQGNKEFSDAQKQQEISALNMAYQMYVADQMAQAKQIVENQKESEIEPIKNRAEEIQFEITQLTQQLEEYKAMEDSWGKLADKEAKEMAPKLA